MQRIIIGKIKCYAREIKDFGKNYKRGFMIEYSQPLEGLKEGWHNLISTKEALTNVEVEFPKGKKVVFKEKQSANNPKFWNYVDNTLLPYEDVAGPEEPETPVTPQNAPQQTSQPLSTNESIVRQVLHKLSVRALIANQETKLKVQMGSLGDNKETYGELEITPEKVKEFAAGLEKEFYK